ncbi:MAG: DUF2202 domain-containing protein [Anaerolineales bacterium]|nr:DUF2202 domain-containing protein [Anaerolineales bacterium]
MKINTISRKYILIVFVGLFVLLSLAACTSDTSVAQFAQPVGPAQAAEDQAALPEVEADVNEVEGEGYTSFQPIALSEVVTSPANGELSEAEAAGLIFMREEEKLARDVYITLYDQWGLPLFQNISKSEQTHTDAVKALLDNYGLDDPMLGNEVGVFSNPELQALYDQLVIQGNQSLIEALKVGVAIEEIDILDLEERLAQTDKADIQRVYENLLNGSYNHLRAFVSTLERQTGETYVPQYMSQDAYDAILSTGMVRGGQGGQGKGSGGNGNWGAQGNGNGG